MSEAYINRPLTKADVAHHNRVWRRFFWSLRPFFEKEFAYTHEDVVLKAPLLVISNHVTRWDPLMVALSFPRNQLYFVASEHLFRLGFVSNLLHYIGAPIAKKKGSSVAADTVMTCMRRFKVGGSVAIFAEGETTWDGKSIGIFPATGKLAKISGATLVTYRLEGGYFTLPRWGKYVRRGKMHGHPVNVYPPEALKKMTPQQITDAINRDIYEDAYARQRKEQVSYTRRIFYRPANFVESALFLCPKCNQIGGLHSKKDTLACDCGFKVVYTPQGFFEPGDPFDTVEEWDRWQMEQFRKGEYEKDPLRDELFGDDGLTLSMEVSNYIQFPQARGRLSQHEESISIDGRYFLEKEIKNMAIVKYDTLLFTYDDQYYELKSKNPTCMRKYLAYWENYHEDHT